MPRPKRAPKAGKYAGVVDKLKTFEGEDPDYQAKVNAVVAAIKAEPDYKNYASHIAKLYAEQRRLKDEIEADLYDCNIVLNALEQMLVNQMEVEGVRSESLETGEVIGVTIEPYAQVQDREKYREWCIKEGLGPLMMVPWATTNALAKQRLLDGLEEPPGVATFKKHKISLKGK